MPDISKRTPGSAWRILAAAGVCVLALAAAVAATGGVEWSLGPLQLRAHEPWRLLAGGLALVGVALWRGGAAFRTALAGAWDESDRHAPWMAATTAGAAMVVGLVKGTRVAGGADAYGYVSQALLWLKGLPIQLEPLAAKLPWPSAEWTLAPLGYRPGVEAGTIVPTYPPGLPLAMAAFAGVGGAGAVYWVVPALGAAAVWLTYLLGRRVAGAASGAMAAILLAASPVFLYQLAQPMSDVPVTAWWLLSLWGAAAGRPLVAGAGAAAAILTRPNLAPVVGVVLVAVAARLYDRHATLHAALRAAMLFVLPVAAGVTFLLWLNIRLYGSPYSTGYGPTSALFAFDNITTNAWRYARWLLDTQTPLVLLGFAAPLIRFSEHRPDPSRPLPGSTWFGLGFIAAVAACYLPYGTFEEWWYLRFLLPALPVLLLLMVWVLLRLAARLPAPLRAPAAAASVAILAVLYVADATARSAFALDRLESRYVSAGEFAARQLPGNAVLLSVQESGPLRMYGRRTTVRFDQLDSRGLDAAVQVLARSGYQAYFALEAWEEAQFRERFSRWSVLGLLDWPPTAEVGRPVRVRFYDPRDRQRYLAGEPVATVREPADTPHRR